MNVYAFDIDGTLETSAGPVRRAQLDALRAQGHVVVIVSPSSAFPVGIFMDIRTADRAANLHTARLSNPNADAYVYVSDNNDQGIALEAGFVYVDAAQFKEGL